MLSTASTGLINPTVNSHQSTRVREKVRRFKAARHPQRFTRKATGVQACL
ncbi:hypothetical protein PAMC26510_05700 [Caballeronia sordidicola]|uniref:Uncharacterized protein n=1 Tax=Caballeronia sordidicola TaxID=196367 RepID=A0A242N6L6_CABSO|nr:hypothetical protein PAMC26510_05700 [Caballeronia sordidicola]